MKTHLAGRIPNVPLNALGRMQAESLAERLPRVDALYSSPIQRAVETAGAIGIRQGMEARILEEVAEFEFGAWTGLEFEQLKNDPRWHEFNYARDLARAPGGESMSEVQQRAVDAMRKAARKHDGETVAVVTHGDVIRALILYAAGTTIRNYWRFTVGAASITELAWGAESDERIIRINDCAHLEGIAA
jgi:probable phosphoglycerate mutase